MNVYRGGLLTALCDACFRPRRLVWDEAAQRHVPEPGWTTFPGRFPQAEAVQPGLRRDDPATAKTQAAHDGHRCAECSAALHGEREGE